MSLLDTLAGAATTSPISALIAYRVSKGARRTELRRQAASDLERELEQLARTLGSCPDWYEPWNTILTLRDRYERRVASDAISVRLDALTVLAIHLHFDLEEERRDRPRLPSTSTMFLAIEGVRGALIEFLHGRRASPPTFPVGDDLASLLERWRCENRRPRELTPAYRLEHGF